ncbi:hypothetical protein BC834DRAFT_948875 [Gloeopeniophorella convolvens]|nr:hypothetical protein BC834DRAFT_948875 [Gloeopeniophorella convolvens]
MSARAVAGGHTLPANPQYLDFERTDGDAGLLPTNTKEIVDKDGQVNYMKPLALEDSPNIHWRRQIATKVAERMGKPPGKNYVLRAWPEGYHMYCHYKGKQAAPRQDLYLMGSVHTKRFRSVPEFVPHAIWLLTDPTLDRGNCECKYCAKVPQRVISEHLGFRARGGSPAAHAPRMHRVGRERERRAAGPRPSEYATVRRAPRPKPETGPAQAMAQERFADLQAMYADADADAQLRRWFREGELVWCALDPPIQCAAAGITFWPGLVDECTFRAETLPRVGTPSIHSADGDYEMEDAAEGGAAPVAGAVPYPITPHPGGNRPEVDRPLPWTVRQKVMYKIKLLGVSHDYIASDTQVLPYQGYSPSRELLQALQAVPIERITSNPEEIAAFDPCPPDADALNADPDSAVRRFAAATAPYSLAIEIASGVAMCWTPTDEWEFKMIVPTSPARAAQAQAEAQTSASALFAADAAPQAVVTQARYQGLWLGAERIWTDDLVRLKAARGQIAPQGSAQILAPSGPSRTTIAEQGLADADAETLAAHGARDRGVFMRLEALFVVDVADPDGAGVRAECRASGMLYELADEDWVEPPRGEDKAVDKGKAREVGAQAQDAWAAAGLATPPRPRAATAADADAQELHVGTPFMSAPSPLKPPPLPNPDPAVPVGDTAAATLAATVPGPTSTPVKERDRRRADGQQLSQPQGARGGAPLPPAPRGFRFRPILPEGFEVVVSLALVSGRYYPRLLAHPLLRPIVRDMQGRASEAAAALDGHHLFALEGILPGFFNASEATRWRPGRAAMVRDAAAERGAGLARVWDERRREARAGAVGEGARAGTGTETETPGGSTVVDSGGASQDRDAETGRAVPTAPDVDAEVPVPEPAPQDADMAAATSA